MDLYKGIVIIPLNRRKLSCGVVKDLVNVPYYLDLVQYANRNNYTILYLTYSRGIVSYDTFLDGEVIRPLTDLWCKIVYEQLIRSCIICGTFNLIFMVRYSNELFKLVDYIEGKGFTIKTPIKGLKSFCVRDFLRYL